MKGVGGNTTAELQTCSTTTNEIGERVPEWHTVATLTGWLDMQTGDSRRETYDAKIEESSHVFIAEWQDVSAVEPENARLLTGGKMYDVTMIDDPMGLHRHLEIYLDYTGGVRNG